MATAIPKRRQLTTGLLASIAVIICIPAHAQTSEEVVLDDVNVTVTRLRGNVPKPQPRSSATATTVQPTPGPAATTAGAPAPAASGILTGTIMTGASSTVITSADIERSPELTLPEILSRQAGIQSQSLYGGVNGAGSSVDMRGFGATGPSNTLVLINGRRLNDWDLQGVDFSAITRQAIERIEITRGNSGAVLYGDGAIGGVINIITKTGVSLPSSARIEAGTGSFNQREVTGTGNYSNGPFSVSGYAHNFSSNGYRVNNNLTQRNAGTDIRYADGHNSGFVTIAVDDQSVRFPGPRNIIPPFINQLASNRRGTNTPFDYGEKQGVSVTAGGTTTLAKGVDLILDTGVRQKDQQFGFFTLTQAPISYGETTLMTLSFTPRLNVDRDLFGLATKILTGVDLYQTSYVSDRGAFKGALPNHSYNLVQTSIAAYWQHSTSLTPDTDLAFGFRHQANTLTARDDFNPAAPVGAFGTAAPGLPLNSSENNRAAHLGLEHRFNKYFAVFARHARAFRVPNVDERIGQSPFFIPTNFDLKTQKSWDVEGGFRVRYNRFELQSSVYDMYLTDEIHFNPFTFANVNLDPTRRYGSETIVGWWLTDTIRFRGAAAYTRAVFRSGPFSGNDVPEVARWTGSAAVAWNIFDRHLVFDGVVRYVGKRFFDGDEINAGTMMVPAYTLVDVRLGGEIGSFFWSFSIQNLFNRLYFDYGLDGSTPGFPFFSVYPLPGRTYMARAGINFDAGNVEKSPLLRK